jgi:malate dehydrogenase (quinone)
MSCLVSNSVSDSSDVMLIGSGIMSASLGAMLKRLEPRLRIQMIEVTPELAREASNGWNNAGTGHAGVCEISYTTERDGSGRVPIDRALQIFEQFEHSKQFWGYAAVNGMAGDPADFIHPVPHICFMQGAEGVDFLKARYAAMKEHHFFREMRLSADPSDIESWAPLVMEGREPGPVAATTGPGTEVDFGLLARKLCDWLSQQENCAVAPGWKAIRLQRGTGEWHLTVKNVTTGEKRRHSAKFVFVGAGGGSLPLLQSTGLPEVAGLGGFPIGGQWLVCDEPSVCARHAAKVYGATPPSAPSLGAPHLDQRRLDGRCQLMFGPFGSWTTRFLKKTGTLLDLPLSVRPDNLTTLLRAGVSNLPLVSYLVTQALQTMNHRLAALREFYPRARAEDWRLVQAGIRVQTIKRADRGAVYFGTEVFFSTDKSVAALLGASPGASVSVNIALEVIKSCLPHLLVGSAGQERMREMIPTFDRNLSAPGSAALFDETTRRSEERLGLAPHSGRRHRSQPTEDGSTVKRTGSSHDLAMAPDCSADN